LLIPLNRRGELLQVSRDLVDVIVGIRRLHTSREQGGLAEQPPRERDRHREGREHPRLVGGDVSTTRPPVVAHQLREDAQRG
jgi:hypothetical protein